MQLSFLLGKFDFAGKRLTNHIVQIPYMTDDSWGFSWDRVPYIFPDHSTVSCKFTY